MSEKFSSPLAEGLYNLTLESNEDDRVGDCQTFGWFALFREEKAILSVDSAGFVDATVYEDVDKAWSGLESAWVWSQVTPLNWSCDGLFLVIDTATALREAPDLGEVSDHIDGCSECQALGNFLD